MNWTFPNLLSLCRLGLIPLFAIALIQGRPERALLVFVVAAVTDGLDGLAARLLKQESLLGAYLDPLADKLLLTTAFVMLTIPGRQLGVQIPIWVTVLVIARDVIILLVSVVLVLALDVRDLKPVALSKWNTAFQIAAVVAVLLSGVVSGFDTVAYVLIYTTAGLTILSGIYYIYRTNRLLESHQNAPT
ncbi:MAG: CDP-alcohol phosphatidyltransferase family protein [Acidobacteriota bacterium]|nr:CDP-alcohol phosphatidyltransferase family protein [Acidobacteriota bacterium]